MWKSLWGSCDIWRHNILHLLVWWSLKLSKLVELCHTITGATSDGLQHPQQVQFQMFPKGCPHCKSPDRKWSPPSCLGTFRACIGRVQHSFQTCGLLAPGDVKEFSMGFKAEKFTSAHAAASLPRSTPAPGRGGGNVSLMEVFSEFVKKSDSESMSHRARRCCSGFRSQQVAGCSEVSWLPETWSGIRTYEPLKQSPDFYFESI